jgi:hypothetical protein
VDAARGWDRRGGGSARTDGGGHGVGREGGEVGVSCGEGNGRVDVCGSRGCVGKYQWIFRGVRCPTEVLNWTGESKSA